MADTPQPTDNAPKTRWVVLFVGLAAVGCAIGLGGFLAAFANSSPGVVYTLLVGAMVLILVAFVGIIDAGARRPAMWLRLYGVVVIALVVMLAWRARDANRSEERQLQLAAESLVRFIDDTARDVAPQTEPRVIDDARQGCGSETPDDRIDYWIALPATSEAEVRALRDAVIRRWRSLELDSYYASPNGDLEVQSEDAFGAYVSAGPDDHELFISGSTDCFHP